MKKQKIIQSIAFILGIIIFNTATYAADRFAFGGLNQSCFSYPAVAMTPYNDSITKYKATHSRVSHKDNNIGLVLLYGQIQMPYQGGGDYTAFSVSFKDPDGAGKRAQVVAELRFVGNNGIEKISVLDSNDYAHITDNVQNMSVPVDWQKLRKTNGYYIVRVYIKRTGSNIKPSAFGYNLCAVIG